MIGKKTNNAQSREQVSLGPVSTQPAMFRQLPQEWLEWHLRIMLKKKKGEKSVVFLLLLVLGASQAVSVSTGILGSLRRQHGQFCEPRGVWLRELCGLKRRLRRWIKHVWMSSSMALVAATVQSAKNNIYTQDYSSCRAAWHWFGWRAALDVF